MRKELKVGLDRKQSPAQRLKSISANIQGAHPMYEQQ